MKYQIKLHLSYDYANPAGGGRHVICVVPLNLGPAQRCTQSDLTITPHPHERLDRQDFFDNTLTEFAFRGSHARIALTMTALVERNQPLAATGASSALADLAAELAQCHDLGPRSPLHFAQASVRVPRDAAMTAFARAHLRPDMNVAQSVVAIGCALHRHMRFDATATTVDTPAAEAFSNRRGVCQDFSHIMIACLRGIGVPAGYVSGYLRTRPPPGKPRLEGADAMHAWVRAWCGAQMGWIEFDPTNAITAGTDHITAAYGRDYSDVAPIKGSLRISGGQKGRQAVDVIPLED